MTEPKRGPSPSASSGSPKQLEPMTEGPETKPSTVAEIDPELESDTEHELTSEGKRYTEYEAELCSAEPQLTDACMEPEKESKAEGCLVFA